MDLLLLLPRRLFIRKLLAALDDLSAGDEGVALVSDLSFKVDEGGLAGVESDGSGRGGRVGSGDLVECRVEGLGETGKVGAEESGRGRLEGFDRVVAGRGGRDRTGLVAEEILVELDAARSVVKGNVNVATAASLGNVTLNAVAGLLLLAVGLERSELDDAVNLERGVDLGELLEETGEDDILEGGDVAGGVRVLLELGENRLDLGGDGEGVEVDLENVEEGTKLGGDALENVAVQGIREEAGTSRGSGKADEGGEAAEATLGLACLGVNTLASLYTGAERDGEGGDEDEGGELLELSIGSLAGHGDTGGVEGVELAVSGGVEEEVVANREDLGHLVVERGHHAGFRGALRHVDQSVNVLSGAETFLPELELNSSVELLEASVEVTLEGVRVVKVDRVRLVGVLLGGCEVGAESLAETAELGLALVLKAELESLVADSLYTGSALV